MSQLSYLHKITNQSIKDGEKTTYEEMIIEGPKGITIKMYSKDKNGIEKIVINGKDDKFVMKTIENDKKDEKELSKDELITELKKNKKLKFAADFAKTQKGGALLKGSKSRSKKGSKAGSKKGSKTGSKKGSKIGSKK